MGPHTADGDQSPHAALALVQLMKGRDRNPCVTWGCGQLLAAEAFTFHPTPLSTKCGATKNSQPHLLKAA